MIFRFLRDLFVDDRTPEQKHLAYLHDHRIYWYPPYGQVVWEARSYGNVHSVRLLCEECTSFGCTEIKGYDYTDRCNRYVNPYFTFDDPNIAYEESLTFNPPPRSK